MVSSYHLSVMKKVSFKFYPINLSNGTPKSQNGIQVTNLSITRELVFVICRIFNETRAVAREYVGTRPRFVARKELKNNTLVKARTVTMIARTVTMIARTVT